MAKTDAIQILSDLHLESPKSYDIFEIEPAAPFLALLGDIGNVSQHRTECLSFLRRQLQKFRTVLFVPGNHEVYHSTWSEVLNILSQFEEDVSRDNSLGEFIVLDRVAYKVPESNTTILGCSLFSSVPKEDEMAVSFGLNDFFHTSDWDVAKHKASHKRDLAWLNDQVDAVTDSGSKLIILTHWSPSTNARSLDPKHAQSSLARAFSTDLSDQVCFTSERVRVWAFGHTHYNCDFTVERKGNSCSPLRLLTNQRGYYFAQASGFDMSKTIELPH